MPLQVTTAEAQVAHIVLACWDNPDTGRRLIVDFREMENGEPVEMDPATVQSVYDLLVQQFDFVDVSGVGSAYVVVQDVPEP